ncbi:MAG: hypothetical protein GY832_10540 [Chloroflexi bacterium]|nr:hypothetical protein [Chloroflexota bacterium]
MAVLAALLLGAARVGALDGVLAPLAAPSADTSFTTVNYQGRLADSGGSPIDNTNPGLGMIFALYDVESGGSPVWTETHANVPVSQGLFSVRLGSTTALDTSHLTGDRWLGIQVGADPEMSPREKLAAVPYAMQAGLALMVSDESITTAKLAANVIPVFAANSSGDSWQVPVCDGSFNIDADYHLIPGLSIDVTVDRPSTLLVDFTGLGYNSSASKAIYTSIFVDGIRATNAEGRTILGGCENSSNDSGYPWCTLANTTANVLDPGNHTVEIRAWCNGTGIARVHAGSMQAILLP